MITTILSKINLIKASNNVLWNIFHKTLILSVFIHVNNFILSQLRQPLLLTAFIGLTKESLDGASDSIDGDRENKRRLIGRHNMMTRLW